MLFALETKVKVAVLTAPTMIIWVNDCKRSARRQWTPAHVIHLCDGLIQRKLLILFLHGFIQAHLFYVNVVHGLLAGGIGTQNLTHLPRIDLLSDQG